MHNDHSRTSSAGRVSAALRGVSLRWVAITFFLASFALGIAGAATGDSFYLRLATEALILSGLALSVDLLLGFTGLLSLGQAMFFGLGAYMSTLVLKHWEPSFWLAICVSVGAGLVPATIAGLIANRVRGVYFALITFGLAQVAARAIYNTRELGASDGLIGIPQVVIQLPFLDVDTRDPLSFFLFMLVTIALLYLGLSYLLNTPFGRVLTAIRTNENRTQFLGYRSGLYVLAAYILAAEIAIFVGAIYPILRGFVSPELMFFNASGNAVINVIVGGVGTLIGPILGTALITGLRSAISAYTEHHLIIVGVLFMASVMFFPKGIAGYVRQWIERRAAGSRDSKK